MALKYNAKQTKIINESWFTLMRAVEHSIQQEKRLTDAHKILKKHFGNVAARAHIMGYVMQGMGEVGPATIDNLAFQNDQVILCYMVGVYLKARDYDRELIQALKSAKVAESEAQNSFLDSLQ